MKWLLNVVSPVVLVLIYLFSSSSADRLDSGLAAARCSASSGVQEAWGWAAWQPEWKEMERPSSSRKVSIWGGHEAAVATR